MLLRGRARGERAHITLECCHAHVQAEEITHYSFTLSTYIYDKCHIVFLGSGQLTNCPKGFELSSNSGQTSTLRVVMAFLGEGSQRKRRGLEKKLVWICITKVHL